MTFFEKWRKRFFKKRILAITTGKVRSNDAMIQIAKSDKDPDVRIAAIREIRDLNSAATAAADLCDIAKTEKDEKVRLTAVNTVGMWIRDLMDPNTYYDDYPLVTSRKIRELSTTLIEIAKTDEAWSVRAAAVAKISDKVILNDIAEMDVNEFVREVTVERLRKLNGFANINSRRGLCP
jgi:HEAT repeat protein